jgi:hypothetical protein
LLLLIVVTIAVIVTRTHANNKGRQAALLGVHTASM